MYDVRHARDTNDVLIQLCVASFPAAFHSSPQSTFIFEVCQVPAVTEVTVNVNLRLPDGRLVERGAHYHRVGRLCM